MGHSNVDMIVKVYSKYIENTVDDNDGKKFNNLQEGISRNEVRKSIKNFGIILAKKVVARR